MLKIKYILLIFLLFSGLKSFEQTYDPSNFTVSNKSYGVSQAVTTDARSRFYDGTNFIMRDFQGLSEVRTYLNLAKYRTGNFIILVHVGGTLNGNGTYTGGITVPYWFNNGTADGNLVPMFPVTSVNSRTGDVVSLIADTLKGLSVDTSAAPRNGYLLTFDSTLHKWKLTAPTGSYTASTGISIAGSVISALNTSALWNAIQLRSRSISTATPAVNDVYKWSGTAWEPAADNSALDTAYLSNDTLILVGGTDTSRVPIPTIYTADGTINDAVRYVNVGDNQLNIGNIGEAGNGTVQMQVGTTSTSQVSVSPPNVSILHGEGADSKSIILGGAGQSILVTDDIDNIGLIYSADYSANGLGVDRWIPDIAAVRSTIHDSSGNYNNANIGAGYRWVIPNTHNIKTGFAGYGQIIDSSSNTNGLTFKSDTATLFPAVRATIPAAITYYNSNIGSGYRLVVPSTNNIKTLSVGYGITDDSTTNTNSITQKLDSTTVFPAIRATIPSGTTYVAGFQTTITGGDTINGDARSYANLVYDQFLGSALSSAWTNSAPNTTVTVANGYLSLVGGSSTDIITNSVSSILHRWTYELKTVIKSVGAGDYFLFGVQSPTGGGPIVCRVKFSDLAGNWYYLNTGNPLGTTATQGTTSIGDTVYLRLKRDNFTLTYEVENHTKGTIKTSSFTFNNILATATVIPFRDFNITLNPFAGSIDIDYARLLNQERFQADYMIIGHSIEEGFDGIVPDSTNYNRLQAYFPQQRFTLFARSGTTVANYNALYKNQILIQQPKNVIVVLGINDVNNGVTSPVFISGLHTLVDTLENYNINVKICYVTPYNAAHKDTIIAFNAALAAAFPPTQLINIYDTLEINGLMGYSIDSLHPNAAGHRYMFNVLKDTINSMQNYPIKLTGPYVYDRAIYTQGLEDNARQSNLGLNTMKLNLGASAGGYPNLGFNVNYYSASNTYTYRLNDYSSRLEVGAGLNYFNVAAPGTAGNSISYLHRWCIDQNGFIGQGTSTPLTFLHIKKQGSNSTPIGNSPWLIFDETLGANSTKQEIDFGYLNGNPYSPGAFGYVETINANYTTGDFYWALRTAANEPSGALATEHMRLTHEGKLGIGTTSPTARLHLPPGTTAASTAPLKFTSGTNLTSAEAGTMEYNGTSLFFTPASTRFNILMNGLGLSGGQTLIGGTGTTDFVTIQPTSGSGTSSALILLKAGNNGGTEILRIGSSGMSMTGSVANSNFNLKAGTTSAGSSPIKFTPGTLMTTPEEGAMEYASTGNYYVTDATPTRYTLAKTLTNTATLDFGNTAAGTSTDLTITVTGAAAGDVVSIGVPNGSVPDNGTFFGWVSASNTVSIRYSNNDLLLAKDPASGTYRITVIKY